MIRHCVDFTGYKEFNLEIFQREMRKLGNDYLFSTIFAIVTPKQLSGLLRKDVNGVVVSGDIIKTTIYGYPVISVEEGKL